MVFLLQSLFFTGLRTLCLAFRIIPQDEYEKWSEIHSKAQKSLVDRDAEVDKASELIEKDMTLVGVTAIEDKLQEGVPESIAKLSQAGIKIWVLTVICQVISRAIKWKLQLILGFPAIF